jgi:hypothetical protein
MPQQVKTIHNVVHVSPLTMSILISQSPHRAEITKMVEDLLAWKKDPDNPDPSDGEFCLTIGDTLFKVRT